MAFWQKKTIVKFINMWPPLLGAGIRMKKINRDFTSVTAELKMRPWNKNYVGTHFGGSIYAMTDPFYMLMLIENLGKDYIVWDKAANVQFIKPGKGTLTAEFHLTPQRLQEIRDEADNNYKVEPVFKVEVKDRHGDVVAEVDKVLYVRRKDSAREKMDS